MRLPWALRAAPALAIAAAKIRAGGAAGKVAEIAHQVQGAIGFTREHGVHRLTRRLWVVARRVRQ